jgi:hypothetical protein
VATGFAAPGGGFGPGRPVAHGKFLYADRHKLWVKGVAYSTFRPNKAGIRLYGAAQESNLPSRGLHDRTGFEDQLGHRAHAAPNPGYQADFAVLRGVEPALGLPLVYLSSTSSARRGSYRLAASTSPSAIRCP